MNRAASQYHRDTSYERGQIDAHYLDWPNQPNVFKMYKGINPILLPGNPPLLKRNLLSILKESGIDSSSRNIGISDLDLILHLTYSLTAKARHPGGDFYYRSAASAGALYPTELYVISTGIDGLSDGLFHFDISRHSLFPLRTGDLTDSIGGLIFNSCIKPGALTFILTAIYFRSSWKYRDRAYRYNLLDTGHVIENLYIAMKALEIPLAVSYDFNDVGINRLIGVDSKKEVALAVAANSGAGANSDQRIYSEIDKLPENILNTSIVSDHEIEYSAIQNIHKAGEMYRQKEALSQNILPIQELIPETWHDLPDSPSYAECVNYPGCLFLRRSRRNFVNEPIGKDKLYLLLDSLCSDDPLNLGEKPAQSNSLCIGFLTKNIEDIPSGLYVLDTVNRRFGKVFSGSFIQSMSRVCLDQEWLRNASVHFAFISNLDFLERIWGARGYRYAMMTAGRMGQRIYLVATSLELGCCGIGAFYDSEAAELIGLEGSSKLLYLVAVGKVKRLQAA